MRESAKSGSPGSSGLSRSALRAAAARHGARPDKALGQSFLADPNLARRIVSLAGVESGDRVLEIGAGLGSLTVPLAAAGAAVTAIEFDRALVPALREVVSTYPAVEVVHADAMKTDWPMLLKGHRWKMVSNLPYNIAVPLLMEMVTTDLPIDSYLVMVQREVGERLVARPSTPAYGAVSVRLAYFAKAKLLRRIPRTVFWPMPKVESVLVSLTPLEKPAVAGDPSVLFRVIDEGFAQRRKTMTNALRRLGLTKEQAASTLAEAGIAADSRAEQLDLAQLGEVASAVGEIDGRKAD